MSTFGERLRSLRISRNMSQEDLAKLLGTSKQVISRYENDKRVPKLTVAAKYAAKLSVPFEYLIDNNDNKPATKDGDGQLSNGAKMLDAELKKHGIDSSTLGEDDIRMIAAMLKAKYDR